MEKSVCCNAEATIVTLEDGTYFCSECDGPCGVIGTDKTERQECTCGDPLVRMSDNPPYCVKCNGKPDMDKVNPFVDGKSECHDAPMRYAQKIGEAYCVECCEPCVAKKQYSCPECNKREVEFWFGKATETGRTEIPTPISDHPEIELSASYGKPKEQHIANTLPTDIEILLTSSDVDRYETDERRIGFQKGAKWMRDEAEYKAKEERFKVLVWLGYWRDKMPSDAVEQLQDIIAKENNSIK